MPIYAYRCTSCGHAKDVLQKISDPLLTVCPSCGAETFTKQVTAAGFQLKGSGWYVTDFRGGNNPAGKDAKDAKAEGDAPAKSGDAAVTPAPAPTDAKAAGTSPAPAAPAAAPAPAPAPPPASSGGSGSS
jgi:putative FmdB family regulatory protein